jgi:hypothetical protein
VLSDTQVVESGSKCVNGAGVAIDTGLGETGRAAGDAVDDGDGVGTFNGEGEGGAVQASISRAAEAASSARPGRQGGLTFFIR